MRSTLLFALPQDKSADDKSGAALRLPILAAVAAVAIATMLPALPARADDAKIVTVGDPLCNGVMVSNYDSAGTRPETSDNPATKTFYKDFLTRFRIS
jgi:hypothetical protein